MNVRVNQTGNDQLAGRVDNLVFSARIEVVAGNSTVFN